MNRRAAKLHGRPPPPDSASADHAGTPDIWLRQVSGGEPVRLTNDTVEESDLAFAPDGESIYFSRLEQGTRAIWQIGTLGGQARKVITSGHSAAPSPDGRVLAYIVPEPQPGNEALVVSALDGSEKRVLAPHIPWFPRVRPAWAFDGHRIAYIRAGLFAPANLFVVDTRDGRERQVTRFTRAGQTLGTPVWLPDILAVKNLEARNLIVPIVGDFAGSTALRSVARYAREHDAPIAAFYGSNVPDLLTQHQIAMFCANLSAMPISAASLYLGGDGDGTGFTGPHLCDNVTPNCEVRRAFIGADVRSAIAATALRALPVTVLATRFGVPDAPPPIYPFEIHVATAPHFPIAAYGAAGDEWLAPIGWTGQGVVGVDGGINVELHPVGDQTASGARISYTVIPACLGCILSNAARFFPEAFRQWTEEYDRDGKHPISVPAGLKTATAGPHLVAFELPREGGLIVRGEAFYDAAVEPRYEEIHMSLPEADKELADFLLNYFGGRARPR